MSEVKVDFADLVDTETELVLTNEELAVYEAAYPRIEKELAIYKEYYEAGVAYSLSESPACQDRLKGGSWDRLAETALRLNKARDAVRKLRGE